MIRSVSRGKFIPNGALRDQIFPILIRAAVSIAILAFLLWWLPLETMVQAFKRIPASVWLFVVAGFLFGHFISALKWRSLLRAAGVPISVPVAVSAHGAGLFANLCLPSVVGGDVVRAGWAIKGHGQAEAVTLGSLVDRVNDTLALVLLAGVAGFVAPDISNRVSANILVVFAIILPLAVVSGVLLIRYFPHKYLPKRLRNITDRLQTALSSLLSMPRVVLTALVLSLSIQGGFVALNIVLASAMKIEAPVSLWFLGWPLAKLVALAPVSLGGIGVREVALAGLLAPFGIAPGLAVAQSLSWELVLIVSGLVSGLAVVIVFRRTAMGVPEKEEVAP